MVLMAIAIIIVALEIQMPKMNTQYFDGSGPVFAGAIFPLLFITISCGAISGFHALIWYYANYHSDSFNGCCKSSC